MRVNLAEYFKGGFSIGCGFDTDEILLDEKRTKGNILAFLCYDANLVPSPDISTWSEMGRKRVLDVVRERTNAINAEVWVDDVKVKNYIPEARDERD